MSEGAYPVPLRECAVCVVGFDGEAGEELVGFDVVREVAACGVVERVGVRVVKLAWLDALVIGDYERACLIEYPVVGQGALASSGPGRKRSSTRSS